MSRLTGLIVKSGVKAALGNYNVSADLYEALDEEVAELLVLDAVLVVLAVGGRRTDDDEVDALVIHYAQMSGVVEMGIVTRGEGLNGLFDVIHPTFIKREHRDSGFQIIVRAAEKVTLTFGIRSRRPSTAAIDILCFLFPYNPLYDPRNPVELFLKAGGRFRR